MNAKDTYGLICPQNSTWKDKRKKSINYISLILVRFTQLQSILIMLVKDIPSLLTAPWIGWILASSLSSTLQNIVFSK